MLLVDTVNNVVVVEGTVSVLPFAAIILYNQTPFLDIKYTKLKLNTFYTTYKYHTRYHKITSNNVTLFFLHLLVLQCRPHQFHCQTWF